MATLVLLLLSLYALVRYYFYKSYQFWAKKNVATITPKFPLGNCPTILPTGYSPGLVSQRFYKELKERNEKFGGVYYYTEPHLVVVDPEYIRDILVTDFQYFNTRGVYYNAKVDPISANLFALEGHDWRRLKSKLTSSVSLAKLKMMFPLIEACSSNLSLVFGQSVGSDIDVNKLFTCYTSDVMSSYAFGIEGNCLVNPDAEFRIFAEQLFDYTRREKLRNLFILSAPKLAHKLGIPTTSKTVENFFMKTISEVVEHRTDPKNSRNDLMQILIDLKNANELSFNELAAQAFVFYIAGYETSAKAMTFTLYELAKHPDIQEKVRTEVLKVLQKHDGFTYEALAEMKYLEQTFNEVLRLHTPLATLTRLCTREYTLRNTDIVLEKGTKIIISATGIHKDPQYYPDPEKFDPDRFSDENKANRHPSLFLPFGCGPRNCIGTRLALILSQVGIASIIKDYEIRLSPNCKPLKFDENTFLITNLNTIWCQGKKINKLLN